MIIRFLTLAVVLVTCASPAVAQLDVADEVFYHFMPIAWRDSDNDTYRFGDFGGMTDSLDYLEELGITAVWMNPIFPSPAYHGYQHGPADQLNAWFGNEAEFINFVEQAHARGIKVFLDYVVYGINCEYEWFQDAYGNPSSPYDDWLAFEDGNNLTFRGSNFTSWNGANVCMIHWDLRNPNPVALVTQWGQYWLDPNGDGDFSDGVDGYRLDHVWENYPDGPDGWGYNLDDFWIPWKQDLRAVNPDVFTFAEQAQWGQTGASLLPAFDAAFTKPFESAARSALANENANELYATMAGTLAELPADRTFLAIIGDHDVDRLTSVIGGSLDKARAAAAVLLLQPLPPIIYHGDEIGMLGFKHQCYSDANDIAIREPFKWNAVAGPPMTNYWVLNSCAFNNRYSYNNDGRSVEEQAGVSGSLLEEYRLLIATRHAHMALRRGSYHPVAASNDAVWAFVRHLPDDETLIVAINLSGTGDTVTLGLGDAEIPGGSTPVTDVISGDGAITLTDANKEAYPLWAPAYGYRILEADLVPGEPEGSEIDGVQIPEDFAGAPVIVTQNNATGLGDNVSELNQLFVQPEEAGLRIGLTGNLDNDASGLCLLFDTAAGGQNELRIEGFAGPPATPLELSGLQLDVGFEPDQFIYMNAYGSSLYVDQIELTDSGDTPKTFRGYAAINSGTSYLVGGENPAGMLLALNNTNVLGVTDTDASGAATATTGFEMFVPYAYIELPEQMLDQTIGVCAFIVKSSGSVSNQWLPGLGGGYDNLGFSPDMTAVSGVQHVWLAPRLCPGDCNCDGFITFADIMYFVAAMNGYDTWMAYHEGQMGYGPTCPWENCDADQSGFVNFADIMPFVDLVGTSCP